MFLKWFPVNLICSIHEANCPTDGNLTASKGILKSPGYPKSQYPRNTRCVWVITVPRGEHVKLVIKTMDLEYCTLCHCDYVEVREGASSNGQRIGRFCNAKKTAVYSEGRQMWVTFRSDIANEGRGFFASYSRIKLRKSKYMCIIFLIALLKKSWGKTIEFHFANWWKYCL